MNKETQTIFNGILVKLSRAESLADHERSFLRARRFYLTRWQKIKYGDILYFNKQFLFQKMRRLAIVLVRFAKEIIINLLVGLAVLLINKYFGKIRQEVKKEALKA